MVVLVHRVKSYSGNIVASIVNSIDDYFHIGSDNKVYKQAPRSGANIPTAVEELCEIRNANGTDFNYTFLIDVPYVTYNGKNLYIDGLKVGVCDADSNDKIDSLYVYGYSSTYGEPRS